MCAVWVVEGSGVLCPALRLPGRGYRIVRPQRVCGSEWPSSTSFDQRGAGKPSIPRQAESSPPPQSPVALGWEVCVKSCVGISLLLGLWDKGCPVTLRDPQPCARLLGMEDSCFSAALDARGEARYPV